ncbi:MAG: Mrp/NBP35 family ATP-binding protein [Acidobacteriota bacterium]|nr:MAG: Mrp/NBP35 family ATP-binding protein [Acidobacteriota bacterium]
MTAQNIQISEEAVLNALRQVIDPDLKKDVVSLGMIKDLRIEGAKVAFRFVLTTPACPVKDQLEGQAREAVTAVPGVGEVDIRMDAAVPRQRTVADKKSVAGVGNIIAVTSGKGGVGKSTVSVNLACALAKSGARVGLVDCDVYGPNVPIMLGLSSQPQALGNQIVPLEAYGLKVMSMGFLAEGDTPLIWRGPMLHGVIQQFLYQVAWGELDYLIADLPPGTGDVQLSLIQSVPLTGGIVVTTPQDVALSDARKGIMMFKQVNVNVLGIVENMSFFSCPHCGENTDIFSSGGGEKTSQQYQVPFLGRIPLETAIREGGDRGRPVVITAPEGAAGKAFSAISEQLAAQISTTVLASEPTVKLEI